MAKLSAHGNELLRLAKETDITDPAESCDWQRVTRVYMSDGKCLQKLDVHFKADTFRPTGESYSYGWKLHAKAKPGFSGQDVVDSILRNLAAKPESKWKVIKGGPKPVIISQSRIMRAVESGDNLGFCKACGAEAYGVEPDARNYSCESCGQHEVYGAEEMLMA